MLVLNVPTKNKKKRDRNILTDTGIRTLSNTCFISINFGARFVFIKTKKSITAHDSRWQHDHATFYPGSSIVAVVCTLLQDPLQYTF